MGIIDRSYRVKDTGSVIISEVGNKNKALWLKVAKGEGVRERVREVIAS